MACRPSLMCLVALVLASALVGCQGASRPVPFVPPTATALAPADGMIVAAKNGRGRSGVVQASATDPARPPRNVLALSGGGAYGAYSAGFLAGWTNSGSRPEFDVVTGISTGSLIGTFAFLGPEYDARAAQLYTKIQAADVFRVRTWVTIPFTDSVASSAPLRELIESQIDAELMRRIAAEHRKGRRLYVGTTNLDTRRLVVWDMGAIANRPCPENCQMFRDVLLASCSVPGMMSPVTFNLEVDGKPTTELHADGGVTAQLFVPSQVFAAVAGADGQPQPAAGPGANGNLYLLISGKLYPDAAPVRRRVLPVLGATTGALLYAHCRAECANLYGLARAANMGYHLTALPQGFETVDSSVSFDQREMTKLFYEGVRQGTGPVWATLPPALSPGDNDYIRTGPKLQTAPPPGTAVE